MRFFARRTPWLTARLNAPVRRKRVRSAARRRAAAADGAQADGARRPERLDAADCSCGCARAITTVAGARQGAAGIKIRAGRLGRGAAAARRRERSAGTLLLSNSVLPILRAQRGRSCAEQGAREHRARRCQRRAGRRSDSSSAERHGKQSRSLVDGKLDIRELAREAAAESLPREMEPRVQERAGRDVRERKECAEERRDTRPQPTLAKASFIPHSEAKARL